MGFNVLQASNIALEWSENGSNYFYCDKKKKKILHFYHIARSMVKKRDAWAILGSAMVTKKALIASAIFAMQAPLHSVGFQTAGGWDKGWFFNLRKYFKFGVREFYNQTIP